MIKSRLRVGGAGFLFVILGLYDYDFDLIKFGRNWTHSDGLVLTGDIATSTQ
jgi:hypothetical protein